jgi:hypothetical protein
MVTKAIKENQMMKLSENEIHDLYLRHKKDDSSDALDKHKRNPRPSFARMLGTSPAEGSQHVLPVRPGYLLAPGAVLCCDDEGKAGHLYPGKGTFIGFCVDMLDGDRVLVMTKGVVLLKIPDVKPLPLGQRVFATGINSFTLSSEGGTPVGIVIHYEKQDFARVLFAKGGQVEERDWCEAVGHSHRQGLIERTS